MMRVLTAVASAMTATLMLATCGPIRPASSDAGFPEVPFEDGGDAAVWCARGDCQRDGGAADAGADAGILGCLPNATQWTHGDAQCGRAEILFATPVSNMVQLTGFPVDVNDRGTALFFGAEWLENQQRLENRNVVWRDGGVERLPELEQYEHARALALGQNDEVVGRIEGNDRAGFIRWPDGGVQLLGYQVYDVNRRGELLVLGNGRWELWSEGEVFEVPIPGVELGGAEALRLNDRGQVVGVVPYADRRYGGFVWSRASGFVDLGHLCVGGFSRAVDISDEGTVLLECSCPSGPGGPVLVQEDGGMRRLAGFGLPTVFVTDMNERDWVVGDESIGNRFGRAVLIRNGGRCVLEKMLPPDSGWLVDQAMAVSNTGLVLGVARPPGETYGVSVLLRVNVPGNDP